MHKLAVVRGAEEISGNAAATCRYNGISRHAYYTWKRRYEDEGFEGLDDRSNDPHHQSNKIDPEVLEKILWLCRRYHFSPHRIAMPIRVRRTYPRNDQRTTIQFIDHVLSKLLFQTDQVQTDNGQEFGSAFRWHLLDKGIGHAKTRPRTPSVNNKVERSHRIDPEEFCRLLEGEVIDDANVRAERLQQ